MDDKERMDSIRQQESAFKKMSVFRYFTSELTRGYLLEREEEKYALKRQRVYTFIRTPTELEKFCTYGVFQCVDAFLFIFTFLPLRIVLALLKMFTHPCGFMRSRKLLEPAQICDILKGIILVVCCTIMTYIDTSMMYHLVRGQSTIKLYVFFNMLDMADRLLSTIGQDILDALFWTATEPRGRKREHVGTIPHLLMAIIYVMIHTMLILFQATVLNVAFNSHNKSLLVIMMSNNFVEIKSNLFKKVDVSHLYQISCSDARERFHYVLLLSIVCIRNMTEVAWNIEHLWVLLPDAFLVLFSELLVDWGKHAFVLKFNEIPADVYSDFKVKLALDMASSRQNQAFTDPSDLVSRRMGLTPLPLACLLFKILSKTTRLSCWMSVAILFVLYFSLMSFKILNSIILLGHSYSVIRAYNKQSEAASKENEGGVNGLNQSSSDLKKTASFPDKTPSETNADTLKEGACDDVNHEVMKNDSHVFFADSYSDLTMIPNNTVIEPSPSEPIVLSSTESENSIERSVKPMDNGEVPGSNSHDRIHETCNTIGSITSVDDNSLFSRSESEDRTYETCNTTESATSLNDNICGKVPGSEPQDRMCETCHTAESATSLDVCHESVNRDSSAILRQRKSEKPCSADEQLSSFSFPENIGIPEKESLTLIKNHEISSEEQTSREKMQ